MTHLNSANLDLWVQNTLTFSV